MKLKLPLFAPFDIVYDKQNCTIEDASYLNEYFTVYISDEYNYLYGYISPTPYFDDAIVKSDDIELKYRNEKCFRAAYNKVTKQLVSRYKQWVNECLYENLKGV